MNRFVRGIICVVVGTFKSFVLKIERGKNIHINFPTIISPNTEITVDKGGRMSIGEHMSIRSGGRLVVRKNGSLSIGKNFYMNTGCLISAHQSIKIGNNVELGPGVLIYDQDHDFRVEGGIASKKFNTSPVSIGNNVWIGANSIILRGTNIGDNCVIGAGCIVKGDFPHNSVVIQKRETEIRRFDQ